MTATLFNTRLAYSLPAFALAVIGIPVYVYLPKFYTDVVGVDIGLVGALLFGVRLFDAVTDPVVGSLSDNTHSRFGRRRPYIIGGAVLLAISLYFLFNPPMASKIFLTAWFGVWIYLLFLFWTLVTVPYEALGPEITYDYNARTTLFAWRDGFLIAGTLAAAASPALIQSVFGLDDGPLDQRRQFFWISVIYAPMTIVLCAWCVAAVGEKHRRPVSGSISAWRGVRTVAQNRPFMILLAAYTISAIGSNLPATLILYYVAYVLESAHAEIFLLIYFVSGILFLPAWVGLSRRVGKKAAWIAAMAINTGAFGGVFFLGPGDAFIYGVLVTLSGIGFGATMALPSAIQADVIDYDELKTGVRREGQYIGLWSIAKKLAAAVGVGAGLVILDAAGYAPNSVQTETVRETLRALYALVPSLCNLAGMAIVFYYPISERVHARIRTAIDGRRTGEPINDPLAAAP